MATGFLGGLADSSLGAGMQTAAGRVAAGIPNSNPNWQQNLQTDADLAKANMSGQVQQSLQDYGQNVDPMAAAAAQAIPAFNVGAPPAPAAMATGGPVRGNYGADVNPPNFERGPAIPASGVVPGAGAVGPGLQRGGVMPRGRRAMAPAPASTVSPDQGIIPASPEGQVLTMDQGGAVPSGAAIPTQPFVNPMGGATPQVSGLAAGLSSGIAQGMVEGRDLYNAYQEHKARSQLADSSAGIESAATGIDEQQQPGFHPIDDAKNAVEHFFQHLHGGLLDDNHLPNSAQGAPNTYNPTGTANPVPGGAQPTPAAGSPSPVQGGAAGAPPAQPAPAAAPAGAPAPAAAPAAGGQPPTPTGAAAGSVQQASTVDAVKQAATDPSVQAGKPDQLPQEHSLSPDWFAHSEQLKMKAMRAAALAGEDPVRVGAAMDALRTGAVQGQIVKNLATANVAFMNGDDKSLRQALSNVNYYLPNGQGIKFKTATQADVDAANKVDPVTGKPNPLADPNIHVGALMYRNPFYGLAGHEGEPEFTSVTAQHISMLGTAALDPTNVQKAMLESYKAQAEYREKAANAQGVLLRGQGILNSGTAALKRADVEQREAAVKSYLMASQGKANLAHADYYEAQANKAQNANSGAPKVTFAAYQSAQKAAASAVDDMSLGQQVSVPAMVNGQPNLSPGAGRTIRDPNKIAPIFQGMAPDQINMVKGLAQSLAGANLGGTSPYEAADAAARIVRNKEHPQFHIDPATKQRVPDVMTDKDGQLVHVWVGNGYKNFYLNANVSEGEGSPVSSGGADEGSAVEGHNAADDEPAEDNTAQLDQAPAT